VAGGDKAGYRGDGGQATSAGLYYPYDVTFDVSRNIYIADSYNHRIRLVTKSTGIITTVAGDGTAGYKGDGGLATSAGLFYPFGVAVDASGNIYIADTSNYRIRMVTSSTGIITTVAGDGTIGYKGDGGPATSAGLYYPYGVTVDASGNIYIADTSNYRIRLVTRSTGIITTVAGDGTAGYKGDGGPATSASLFDPWDIAVDASGNIYIADAGNHRVRLVTRSSGIITTVAGDGTVAYYGDGGQATLSGLYSIHGIAVDASGNIYIADYRLIRLVTKNTGIITTVAGNSNFGYSGDGGPATSASMSSPGGVCVDASGSIYFADSSNSRIRLVTPIASAASLAPSSPPISSPPSASPTTPLSSRSSSPPSASPTTPLSSRSSSPPSASPTTPLSSRPSSPPSASPTTPLSSRSSSPPSASPTTPLSSRSSSPPSASPTTSLSPQPSLLLTEQPTGYVCLLCPPRLPSTSSPTLSRSASPTSSLPSRRPSLSSGTTLSLDAKEQLLETRIAVIE
jgi:trimeric autotransporter adhesin